MIVVEAMNPFVNPNKRDVTLPPGCKDLIDVLKPSGKEPNIVVSSVDTAVRIRMFVGLILYQARQDGATEVIIGAALPSGGTPIRYKVNDNWVELPSHFPSDIRAGVIDELAKMAKFPAGQISGNGLLEIRSGSASMKWTVTITSVEEECRLVRVTD